MSKLHNHTLYLILADNLLNWFLGGLLTFFPHTFEQWLAPTRLFPINLYVVNGVCFLLFASWQVMVFLPRWQLRATNLKIAAYLAWGPVMGLTIMLLLPLELYPLRRALFWVGDCYMLWLGWWYWQVAKKTK